ncbi:unnamed protein product [Gongylonema pulchrum]|uniref:Threonylcarbamoyl-AMP synthase n=1 Tax=Gongylonema pulchrum TaxID=637853 RepID=A0A183E674_9BILA|nr:unnamed protein product [Gongylonema pulchrum]
MAWTWYFFSLQHTDLGPADWRLEDMLDGQSVFNAQSIQNAQMRIANDASLSAAQIARARELLQELLFTITVKPEHMPLNGGAEMPEARRMGSGGDGHRFGTEDEKRPNFTDRWTSEYPPSEILPPYSPIHQQAMGPVPARERDFPRTQNPPATSPWPTDSSAAAGYHPQREPVEPEKGRPDISLDAGKREMETRPRHFDGRGMAGRGEIGRPFGEIAISRCMQVFEAGGLVVVPTDTLYGVVTTIANSDKLYKLKRRSRLKPLGLFVSNMREIQRFVNLLNFVFVESGPNAP